MNVAIYSTRPWDETYLGEANTGHDLRFLEAKLDHTTTSLAADADAVCVFVNDLVDRQVIGDLAGLGVRFLALRSAGFNHVDLVQPTAHLPQRARHRGTRPSSLRRQCNRSQK